MNEFYEENGYLLVRGVFDAGEVEEMRDAIARILESVEGTAADRNVERNDHRRIMAYALAR